MPSLESPTLRSLDIFVLLPTILPIAAQKAVASSRINEPRNATFSRSSFRGWSLTRQQIPSAQKPPYFTAPTFIAISCSPW